MLNFRLARPAALVDLGAIEELAGIRVEDDMLVVGAMTRQWDLEHSRRRVPAPARRARFRRSHGDALPGDGRRLARPRRPDRRAAGLCARARRRAGDEPADDPGRGVLRLGVHDRARARRAAGRGPLPRAVRPDRVRGARPPPRRLRRRLRRGRRRPGRASAAWRRRRCSGTAASSTRSATCSRPPATSARSPPR